MSEIKVDSIGPRVDSGTLTIGAAGDTVNIAGTAGTGFPTPTTGIAASAITTGTMATARLGSGTASSSTFLRGDQTYAAAGGGKVIQVVSTFHSTNTSTSSTSFVSMCSLNITPSLSSSKIFGAFTTMIAHKGDGSATTLFSYLAAFRDSTNVHQTIQGYANLANDDQIYNNVALNFLDSPSTTSQIAYSMQVKMIVTGKQKI